MSIFPTEDPQYSQIYATEAAMVDASELIATALEKSKMSQADLARALQISRSEITARLRGERNMTIRTLAETLHAMGEHLYLGFRDDADTESDVHSAVDAVWSKSPEAHTEIRRPASELGTHQWVKKTHVA